MKLNNASKSILIIAVISFVAVVALAADDASTYLILNDIPPYTRVTIARDIVTDKIKSIPGYTIYSGPGILAGADHLSIDHSDITFETDYQSKDLGLGMEVQVTQHAGADSDKWLMHEIDSEFRNYYGVPGNNYAIVKIEGNTIMEFGSGGWDYRWLSGNKVIKIEYTDLDMKKPEPLEVIKSYLAKHPSTLPTITLSDLRSATFKTIWIKDEMDRRLWLCDKWFMQLQLKKAEEKDVYRESVKSMNIFLDYREKYYGLKGADEKNLLAGYLNTNNGTGIMAKLTEYKNWWVVNKTKAIRL